MIFKVLSWNIRHFRTSKAEERRDYIVPVIELANLAFFYEAHAKPNEIFKALQLGGGWNHEAFETGDEYLMVVWRDSDGMIEISDIGRNAEATEAMKKAAGGYRPPVVFDVFIDTRDNPIRIGAWHAPGPAQGVSPDLGQRISYTANILDLLVGDMNYQATPSKGGRCSDRIKRRRMQVAPTKGSSTYTDVDMTNRESAIDVAMVSVDCFSAITAELLDPRRPAPTVAPHTFGEAYVITDHVPLLVSIDLDIMPDESRD